MTPEVGSTLGRYRLEASLGRGGMAEVFRATDQRLGRSVAVKVILPSYSQQPQFVERFLREARLVAALEHPNIVPVYDFGEHQGAPFLVMPFLEGGTLAQRLTGAPLPPARAAGWIRQLAEALDAAHQQGILHRDVKPGNVLIGKGDRLMLADFGIAKMTDSATRLTATGSVIGTPVYMAPELAQGRPASTESDLYALAVMAYEMVTGRPPFTGDSALSVLHQHVHTPPPRPSATGTGLPAALDDVFAAALAKDPAQRPAPGRILAERFEAAVATAAPRPGVQAVPDGVASERTTLLPTDPRQPTIAGVGGRLVIALLLALVAISGWLSFGRLRREAASEASAAAEASTSEAAAPAPAPMPPPAPSATEEPAPSATDKPARATPPAVPPSAPPSPPPTSTPAVANDQRGASSGPAAPAEPAVAAPESATGPLERLRGRAGGARPGSRLSRPGAVETARELPRPGTIRMAAADFERIRDLSSRGERAGHARAGSLRTYADGGLAYLAGDDAAAARKLRELSEQETAGADLGPLSLLRKLAGTGAPPPWLVAVAYGDPRRNAGPAIATELAAHPDNLAALFAQAMVAHLDGNHRQAAEAGSALQPRVPQALAGRTLLYVAEEREHAGDPQAALAAYRRVAETRSLEAGFAAVQGARVALTLQLRDEARRILDSACRNQARAACERLRQLDAD